MPVFSKCWFSQTWISNFGFTFDYEIGDLAVMDCQYHSKPYINGWTDVTSEYPGCVSVYKATSSGSSGAVITSGNNGSASIVILRQA